MKGFAGFLVAALILAAVGAVCVAVSRIEGHLADVHEQTATLQFDRAQQSLDAAGDYVGYTRWVPVLGNAFRNDIRFRQAALQYWQDEFDSLTASQEDAAPGEDEPPVELQLVVANAGFRTGLAQAKNRAGMLQALDAAVARYGMVLRAGTWLRDAAFNYEYTARLREDVAKGRRATVPARGEDNDLGVQGMPAATTRDRFELYIPLDNEERSPAGGDAAKAPPGARKG